MMTIEIMEGVTITATEDTCKKCEWLVNEEPLWRAEIFNLIEEAEEWGESQTALELWEQLWKVEEFAGR